MQTTWPITNTAQKHCLLAQLVDAVGSRHPPFALSWSRATTACSTHSDQQQVLSRDSSILSLESVGLEGHSASRADIEAALCAVVAECGFAVSLGDPTDPERSLRMVSRGFEEITGWPTEAMVGRSCRILAADCVNDPEDLARLRGAWATGAPTSAVLTNRRSSGELFRNLVHLRGLSLAFDTPSGEQLWFIIGIHKDVTEINGAAQFACEYIDQVAQCIQATVAEKLMICSWTAWDGRSVTSPSGAPPLRLLARPTWRAGPGASARVRRQAAASVIFSGAHAPLSAPPSLMVTTWFAADRRFAVSMLRSAGTLAAFAMLSGFRHAWRPFGRASQ